MQDDTTSDRISSLKSTVNIPSSEVSPLRKTLRQSSLGELYRWFRDVSGIRHARFFMGYGVRPRVKTAWQPIGGDVAIHRYYIEEYLMKHAADIHGNCLEFEGDVYTTRIGGRKVAKLDVLNVDDSAPEATIIADLTQPNQIPDNQFDCIICTFVLHCIWDYPAVLRDLKRILKPGGVLIGCVPLIMGYTPKCGEVWRFSPEGLEKIMAQDFKAEDFSIQSYGNSLTAMADVRGLAMEKFGKAELDFCDPRYPVILAFRAVKPH